MWPEAPKNAREAYYQAVAELGVHRDMLQVYIGNYLQAVKDLRERVIQTCPMRLERFDKVEEQSTEGLMDDLGGDEPLKEARDAKEAESCESTTPT